MPLTDFSGLVFSDLTDRMIALRAGSIGLVLGDIFSISDSQKLLVIVGQALEMCAHCAGYLLGILDRKKMSDDLSIVSRLTGQSLYGVALFQYFAVAHDLDLLCRFGYLCRRSWNGRNRTIH